MKGYAMKFPMNAVGQVVEALLRNDAWKATKYLSDKAIVRATRKLFNKKITKRGSVDIILTMGRPKYTERKYIKACNKAGEPFPVKKVQLKFPPKLR